MKRIPASLVIFLTFLIPLLTYSQNQKINSGWCATGISETPPDLIKGKPLLNKLITNPNLIDPNGVIIIPVVFHVVYKNPGENISDSKIHSQIARLNTDFRNLNSETNQIPSQVPAPWINLPADVKVEFRLACIDPGGNLTNGILRKSTTNAIFFRTNYYDVKLTSEGGDDAWPTNTYLNIWVCDIEDLIGHSMYPWEYGGTTTNTTTNLPIQNSLLDGIVLDYTVTGDPNEHQSKNKGRVGVHEAGHWLGLYHTFLSGCNDGDQVSDTPPQHIFTSEYFPCPVFPTISCNNGPNGNMFMNYMDYTPDACMFMFTLGQRDRMRSYFAEFGPTGTRFPFLVNYFSIKKFAGNFTQVCNLIKVNLQNPACLGDVTYTFSGPVTIYSKDNQEIVFKANPGVSSGSITVTAQYGNYSDTYTFSFQVDVPDPVILNPQSGGVAIQEVVAGQTYTCSVTNIPGTTFTWSIESYYPGAVIISGQGTSTITFIPNQCNISRLNQQNRGPYEKDYNTELELCNLTVRVQASVGLCQSLSSAIIFNYAGCGVGNQPCCSYPGQTCCIDCLTQLYPNPTRNSITVESGEKIYTAKITDATGLLYKSIDFKSGAKKFDININELREGLYFINLYDGKNWISRSFQIAR